MAETILGKTYKCKYNSVTGVAVAFAIYINGTTRIALLKNNSDDYLWFDYDLLEEVQTKSNVI